MAPYLLQLVNICNTYNITTIPITKSEIIKKTHTHKLQLTTNFSNPKNIHGSFIINNQTTPTLNNHDQPQPTKLKKKKKNHFPIYFFHEKQREEKLWSLFVICSSICYTNGGFETQIVQRTVIGRGSRFLRVNWGWIEVEQWWCHN